MDLVLSRSTMSHYILFWGLPTVSMEFLTVMNTRGFGPFSQLYELLHTVLGSVEGQFWHLLKHVDLVLSRRFMSYYILFSGLSTVLR